MPSNDLFGWACTYAEDGYRVFPVTPEEKIPLGRTGSPQDVALAVASLCGDDMAYVTGQTVHVNGGVFLW